MSDTFGFGKLIWGDLPDTMMRIAEDKHLSFGRYPVVVKEQSSLAGTLETEETSRAKGGSQKLHIQIGHADIGVIEGYFGNRSRKWKKARFWKLFNRADVRSIREFPNRQEYQNI